MDNIKLIQRAERKRVRSVNAQKRAKIKEWLKTFEIDPMTYDYAWRDAETTEINFYANKQYENHFTSRPGFVRIDEDMLDEEFAYYIFEPQE